MSEFERDIALLLRAENRIRFACWGRISWRKTKKSAWSFAVFSRERQLPPLF